MGVAKAALECAVRYMAAELGPRGIRVHAISPGPLATRAASGIPEFDELLEKAKSKAPTRSLVSIEDVGFATAFLAHEATRLITALRSMLMAATTLSIRSRPFVCVALLRRWDGHQDNMLRRGLRKESARMNDS